MVELDNLKGNNFKEGDEYWTLENVNGELTLLNSTWDDVSEELDEADPNRYKFRYLAYAIIFLKLIGIEYINYVDFRKANTMNINLTLN